MEKILEQKHEYNLSDYSFFNINNLVDEPKHFAFRLTLFIEFKT